MSRLGIYPHDQAFNSALKRLQSAADICQENKAEIMGLVEHLLSRGVSKPRATKYINHLTVLARMVGVPFKQLGRAGVERLVSRGNSGGYTEHTKHDYKIILKKFYQWLRGCDEEEYEYPEEVKWIRATLRRRRLLPEALLTAEGLRGLVEAAENPRDRALILTHY
ncbi:MAG: hypothetical protein QXJ75_02130 [Candidatus Bathyarchaeia archaeon]